MISLMAASSSVMPDASPAAAFTVASSTGRHHPIRHCAETRRTTCSAALSLDACRSCAPTLPADGRRRRAPEQPTSRGQGFFSRSVSGNRRSPVPVYRTDLTGYRSEPVKFKFEFKWRSSTGSYRYTGRLDRFTGRFDW